MSKFFIFTGFTSLILIILVVTSIIIFRQRGKQADFISTSNIHADNFLTDEKFTEFTGMGCESCKLLNENEKMLLVFATLKLDNRQIAVLFNTTKSSIRGRKAKLRNKHDTQNINIKNVII